MKMLYSPLHACFSFTGQAEHLIQDQLDAQFNIDLRKLSEELNLNSTYVSREFPRHFGNQNFGEYIRNARIQKALELFINPEYSLTEIAYLTGFSDQSHFTRVFKQLIGPRLVFPQELIIKTWC
ncbi:MAG: helix-turn-helix transcriptional regulator [Microscillaceae bacterium]|nr:helix-turn-helix transcriptional regulator [Microscillaceae bacterium]